VFPFSRFRGFLMVLIWFLKTGSVGCAVVALEYGKVWKETRGSVGYGFGNCSVYGVENGTTLIVQRKEENFGMLGWEVCQQTAMWMQVKGVGGSMCQLCAMNNPIGTTCGTVQSDLHETHAPRFRFIQIAKHTKVRDKIFSVPYWWARKIIVIEKE
jgi:hypothetical protein